MKKLVAIVVLMITASGAFAQDAISKFFSKYQDDETFSQVTVSSKMFSLLMDMQVDNPEDQEVIDAISKLKGLRILGKDHTRDGRTLYKEALALLPSKDYEELMSVRDEDKDMKFFIRSGSGAGKIAELVMVMGGNDDFMVLSLFGEIDLKQIGKIGSKMDISGLDHLHKLDKNDKGGKDNSKEPKEDKKN